MRHIVHDHGHEENEHREYALKLFWAIHDCTQGHDNSPNSHPSCDTVLGHNDVTGNETLAFDTGDESLPDGVGLVPHWVGLVAHWAGGLWFGFLRVEWSDFQATGE